MDKILDKISTNNWLILIVLIKDLYDVIEPIFTATELNIPAMMNEFLDLVLMTIVVVIVIALLRQYKRQKEDFEIMMEITKCVNLVRAQALYMGNTTYPDEQKMNMHYRKHLLDEYQLVQQKIQEYHPDWSPYEIEMFLSEYYGFTKESLKQ